ncbi:MAG: lipase [Solirubrobacteraceae bacterium]|nr:lipase [Solirubrobacteraceae bacterium]
MTGRHAAQPFGARTAVPVSGGDLEVARTAVSPEEADVVVLAIHGISSSHMVWCPTVRELSERVNPCVLAPDLRGRAGSAALPGPYGFDAHVADLLATLDHAGVERATLVGHSMGAYIATGLAAAHPERTSGVVLLDGGLAVPSPFDADADELVDAMVAGALEHARRTYASADDYAAEWRASPAFAADWNDDVDAYVRYQLTGEPGALRPAVSEAAVRADVEDLVHGEVARAAVDRVTAPLCLLTAPRGLHNDFPLLPSLLVEGFAATHPTASVERIPDVNHYTMLLGGGLGPSRVATAIAALGIAAAA